MKHRRPPILSKEKSIKWMLRGLLFVIVLSIVDYFYRRVRGSGTESEMVLMVCLIISIVGVLQFPIGLYARMRHWIDEAEEKKDK